MMALGLVDRDPKKINDHVKCHFEDVLGEPDSTHSVDCVWRNSRACFTRCHACCYGVFTSLCGVCMAAYWALQVASLVFCHVWCLTPTYRLLQQNLGWMGKFLSLCVHCCVDPLCQAAGRVFLAFEKSQEQMWSQELEERMEVPERMEVFQSDFEIRLDSLEKSSLSKEA